MKLSWVELIGLTSRFLEGNTLNFEVNGKEVKIKYDDDHERISFLQDRYKRSNF